MFIRLGLLVFLLAAMPALVLADVGSTNRKKTEYDEFGNRIGPENDDIEFLETETEESPDSPEFPKMFDGMIGCGFGYGLPIGDFYSNLDSGPLYFGEARIAISGKTYIKFGYRKMNIYRDTHMVIDTDGTYQGTVDLALDVNQYLFSIGWLSAPRENSNLRMYGEFGGVYGNHVMTASAGGYSYSDNEGRLMFISQFGLIVPFSDSRVGMDLGASVLWKSVLGKTDEGWGAILAAHVGLVVLIGGEKDAIEPASNYGW
ncbi:MAG: hypothetical protein KAH56_10695 [Candidatus Krumholzibacteria bacterium]|nr:hypothetical protein [Candidatus Krumholzibacteria bacterium]